MNEKIMKCDKCGTELVPFKDDMCMGLKCPKCNEMKIVTTNTESILFEKQQYTLELMKNDCNDKGVIYKLAKITNNTYTFLKNTVVEGGIIFVGKAVEVKEIVDFLEKNKLKYKLSPQFLYK